MKNIRRGSFWYARPNKACHQCTVIISISVAFSRGPDSFRDSDMLSDDCAMDLFRCSLPRNQAGDACRKSCDGSELSVIKAPVKDSKADAAKVSFQIFFKKNDSDLRHTWLSCGEAMPRLVVDSFQKPLLVFFA